MEKKEMTLNEYQEKAMTTCLQSANNFSYMMLNLVGEVGEFSSKVAKSIRKGKAGIGIYEEDNDLIYSNHCTFDDAKESENELKKEAGDILWQLSGLCHVMGWDLEDVAKMNLDKLSARKAAGTIDGNGDGIIRGK